LISNLDDHLTKPSYSGRRLTAGFYLRRMILIQRQGMKKPYSQHQQQSGREDLLVKARLSTVPIVRIDTDKSLEF